MLSDSEKFRQIFHSLKWISKQTSKRERERERESCDGIKPHFRIHIICRRVIVSQVELSHLHYKDVKQHTTKSINFGFVLTVTHGLSN